LVDLFEYMMMHGLTIPKSQEYISGTTYSTQTQPFVQSPYIKE